ncbi:hypothetical protein FRACA_20103 [Frankia canadensis]|uniref:Uncharacterized protein n=1 Tax=Frankia canadensis TaxID=1836972 RepID=A0A2I2KPV9_9ACTN|nr:hypothetical protein FRACA_20103 [Frankia canadensis]SOU54997.1 hypothetical protein FRACA_20103 [Frankia canadensis]
MGLALLRKVCQWSVLKVDLNDHLPMPPAHPHPRAAREGPGRGQRGNRERGPMVDGRLH